MKIAAHIEGFNLQPVISGIKLKLSRLLTEDEFSYV